MAVARGHRAWPSRSSEMGTQRHRGTEVQRSEIGSPCLCPSVFKTSGVSLGMRAVARVIALVGGGAELDAGADVDLHDRVAVALRDLLEVDACLRLVARVARGGCGADDQIRVVGRA